MMDSEEARLIREYRVLTRKVIARHVLHFPGHDVHYDYGATNLWDAMALWCQSCRKGLGATTDGPHSDEEQGKVTSPGP